MLDYGTKEAGYFSAARREIAPLLPERASRVLELGCGAGATLAWLRATGRAEHAVGVELFASAAQQARQFADEIYCLDFERDPLPQGLGQFDLILCLDVLEHLIDPWAAVDRLVREQLVGGGTLIVSVPNIRHYSVLLPLLFHGRWQYEERGLLDRTHLRFFTYGSAMQLLNHPQLGVARCMRTGFEPGSWKAAVNRMTFGMFREFLAYHYLLSAVKLHDC